MNKKILVLILALLSAVCVLGAYGEEKPDEDNYTQFYTVVFDYDDTAKMDVSIKCEVGKTPSADKIPAIDAKEGYSAKWKDYDFSTAKTGDKITLTVIYTANKYMVTFNSDGGNAVDNLAVTYKDTYVLQTPAKRGFKFLGWYDGDNLVASCGSEWVVAKDVTLVAKWEAQEILTVTFKVDGVVIGTPITVYEGENFDETLRPTLPTKTGYTGTWQQVDLTNITENKDVNVVWTANIYTVTLNVNDGNELADNEIDVTFNSPYAFDAPTKDGYNFKGWYNGDALVALSGATWDIADDVTLTAKWEKKSDADDDGEWTKFY